MGSTLFNSDTEDCQAHWRLSATTYEGRMSTKIQIIKQGNSVAELTKVGRIDSQVSQSKRIILYDHDTSWVSVGMARDCVKKLTPKSCI